MPSTTLTSKGQMTLPKAIRERLNLKAGDRLDVSTEGERIILVPSTLHLDDLCSVLPKPRRVVSLEEMDDAIRRRAAAKPR